MVLSFSLVGRKLGKSSKVSIKSPCSPQPAVGVAVADEAGNGFVELTTFVDVIWLALEDVIKLELAVMLGGPNDKFVLDDLSDVVSPDSDELVREAAVSGVPLVLVFFDVKLFASETVLETLRAGD